MKVSFLHQMYVSFLRKMLFEQYCLSLIIYISHDIVFGLFHHFNSFTGKIEGKCTQFFFKSISHLYKFSNIIYRPSFLKEYAWQRKKHDSTVVPLKRTKTYQTNNNLYQGTGKQRFVGYLFVFKTFLYKKNQPLTMTITTYAFERLLTISTPFQYSLYYYYIIL